MANPAPLAALRTENADLAERLGSLTTAHDALTTAHEALKADYEGLKQQLDWFRRQLFGRRSEKQIPFDPVQQASLFEALGVEPATAPVPVEEISYRRRKNKPRGDAATETGLRFDESVPVTTIEVVDPAVEAIPETERERIGEKVTHRLAQRPASYEVLKYVRPVVKRRDTGELLTARMPSNVLERTLADVSLLAGMLVDKFTYHLPLHRQHRRMGDTGIVVSRSSLTNWAGQAIDLVKPIVDAQSAHVLEGGVLAMDETPVKAGRVAPGKMRQAYFWPVYGEDDEIVFHYAPTREHRHVDAFLRGFDGKLLSDGYEAYASYARRHDVVHAQCWSHTRRLYEQAKESDPDAAASALALIGGLYSIERDIRRARLEGAAKRAIRESQSAPIAKEFFAWCRRQTERADLLPKSPLAKALRYALDREDGLSVFLSDPRVAIDTNHVERGLRRIPTGRRNWMFAWTELGAERIGVIQSLLATCELHGVDPYTYLVDVLQRVGEHPAARVIELTPRVWKTLFADDPLRSDLDRARDSPTR